MEHYDDALFESLTREARLSDRKRAHQVLHATNDDPCHRIFAGLEPGTYVRPHRHQLEGRWEILMGVRGAFLLLLFDDTGEITAHTRVAPAPASVFGIQVPPDAWHCLLCLEPGTIMFEVKPGPFDPSSPREFAPWAPEEASPEAEPFMAQLLRQCGMPA